METASCIFCRIIAGEVPAEFLHNDELVVAIRDLYPKAPTHLLLLPREHVVSAAHLTDADAPMLGRLFAVAAKLAGEAGLVEITESSLRLTRKGMLFSNEVFQAFVRERITSSASAS